MDFKFNIVASFLLITMCLVQSCSAGDLLCVNEQYKYSPEKEDGCIDTCISKYQSQSAQTPTGKCLLNKGLVYCKCTYYKDSDSGNKKYSARYGPTGEEVSDICSTYDEDSEVLKEKCGELSAIPILLHAKKPGMPLCVTENYEYNSEKEKQCDFMCNTEYRDRMNIRGSCGVIKGYAHCTCAWMKEHGKGKNKKTVYRYAPYSADGIIVRELFPLLGTSLHLSDLLKEGDQTNYPILSPQTQSTSTKIQMDMEKEKPKSRL